MEKKKEAEGKGRKICIKMGEEGRRKGEEGEIL